jgi:hypothetical protein
MSKKDNKTVAYAPVEVKLNADGTFSVAGKEATLADVIKLARERRDAAGAAKKAERQVKQAERKAKQLSKAQERLAKAEAALKKAEAAA